MNSPPNTAEPATAWIELMDSPGSLDILVIEDDAHTRANLRDILELDDHRVSSAGSGAEALKRRDWERFSAIILDRCLPDASAEELMPRLKAAAPDAAVIVVTGYSDIQGAIAALRQGATDYLLKPLNVDMLRKTLGRIAELRQLSLAKERSEAAMREAQERALQAERLAAIGQMVTGLAHESRNALQRSQACLEMLGLIVRDQPQALEPDQAAAGRTGSPAHAV
jgi:DNA-binding NtrC family response regulator